MYKCNKCHSGEVEYLTWIDLNTHEEMDGETGEYYCRACQSHTDVYMTTQDEDLDEALGNLDTSDGMDETVGVP